MFGIWLLLENKGGLKRSFLAEKAIEYVFHGERRHLSTRLLRANDPLGATFLCDR